MGKALSDGEVAQRNVVTAGVALITPGENSSGTWEAGRGAVCPQLTGVTFRAVGLHLPGSHASLSQAVQNRHSSFCDSCPLGLMLIIPSHGFSLSTHF